MANITVTAGNGSRAKVCVQVDDGNEFVDQRIDTFASEARTYEVTPNQRLIVEENPA